MEAIDDDGWPHTGDPCSPNSAASGKYGERPASVSTGDIHSLVIASDYRVPDPGRVWPLLQRNKSALADIGAHHVLIYASTHDSGRVLVMIGVRSREPIVELLRSRVFFDWFDAMGVDDIPAVFAGEIVDRFVAAPTTTQSTPRVPGVVVAAFASVNNVSNLTAEVRSAIARFTAAGIRKTWVFQAFDDAHEVLILQEFADEAGARQWIEHPDAAAEWMSGAGGSLPTAVRRPVLRHDADRGAAVSASLGTRPGPGQRPHCGAMDPTSWPSRRGISSRGNTTSTSTIRSRRAAATVRASSSWP